jgi:predicted HicB family RNase H-like nuclease
VGTPPTRKLEEYLELPYHLGVRSEHEADRSWWKATVEELPGCVSRGGTANEAVARLRPAMESWLASALEQHREIPLPNEEVAPPQDATSKSRRNHSGRFLVRMPASLHEQLAREAEHAHVSLNRFVTDALATSVAGSEPEQRSALSPPHSADPTVTPADGSRPTPPRAVRVALATNLVVVVIAGAVALLLLVLALQRGI